MKTTLTAETNMQPKIPTTYGAAFEGGFYAGRIRIDDTEYALIVAPNGDGDAANVQWNQSAKNVTGALSYCDGAANTKAMVKAGSELAKWAIGLRIGDFDDWYLPSQDELEICYRNLKPGTGTNSLYARSGINLSAVPPTCPYTAGDPKQTKAKAFRAGGKQAFAEGWYWTSTQLAAHSGSAWMQGFGDGNQGYYRKSGNTTARVPSARSKFDHSTIQQFQR